MLNAVTARVPWVASPAARRRAIDPRPRDVVSVPREVLRFVLGGLLAALLIAGGSFWAVNRSATADATAAAQLVTQLDGRGVVRPLLTSALMRGEAPAVAVLDSAVRQRVLSERVVRVKIWTPAGRIVYSDAPSLIGRTFPLGDDEEHALATGATDSDVSDLSKPENRLEAVFGQLLEVYVPLRTKDGTQVLFETYQRDSAIRADEQRVWAGLFPVLVAGLALLFIVEVPLSWRLARRLERSGRERAALLERAIDSSETERRRIAGDLHDGPVQYLTAMSLTLGATANTLKTKSRPLPPRAELLEVVGAASDRSRTAIRELRSLIMEIAPADLEEVGLLSALERMAASAEEHGLQVAVHVTEDPRLGADANALVYRAAQESVRNVIKHAQASKVSVSLARHHKSVVLEVVDDGHGFDQRELQRRKQQGHVGLSLLEDRVDRAGATLRVDSVVGHGTRVRLEVPTG